MNIINMTNYDIKIKKLGRNIAKLRRSKSFSQNQLAEIADISREHLAKIETGKRSISLKLLFKISEILGCEVKEFFCFD